MDWETRRKKRQEMGSADSGSTSEARDASLSVADAWERRRAQRQQMDAGSEEARRQRSEEIDRINQARKDQRSLELAQDIALGIASSVVNHWIHPYRSSQAGQTSQMTAEEAGQKYKENQAKIAELDKTVRMGAGKVHTPEVEAQLDALEQEQNELAQYIQQLEDAEAMQHDSAYWAKKASHEEARLREANAYRSGYGGVMQSGILPDTEKAQNAEEIQQEYDKALEYYYDAKDAEAWNRMTPELREKAMEAAALDVNGLFEWNKNYYYEKAAEEAAKEWFGTTQATEEKDMEGGIDWQKADALSRSGLAPDQRAALSRADSDRVKQIRKEISDAGFDADRTLDYANRLRDNQKKQQENWAMADFASGSTAGAIAATVASYGANLLSGIGSVGILAQRIFGSGSGVTGYRPVNYNAPSTIFSSVTSATREAVSAQMGETGQFFYGTLNSAVDSAARMLVAKAIGTGFLPDSAGQAAVDRVNRIVSGAVSAQMSTQVFTDAFLAAKQSGATDDDAILDALVQASIEGITEKYSVDAILKNPNNLVLTALRNNFIAEGSEEIASDFLNTIYDELKNGSDSELRSAAQKYIDAGLDPKEAWKLVLSSYAKQVVLDGLAGGISGIAMGGAAELVDYTQRLQAYTHPYADRWNVQALVDEALELDPENPLAASIQRKLSEKGGDSVSNREIYRLVRQNETAIQEGDRAAVQSAAAARLSELGETGDVEAIGAALAKQAAGEELSGAEQHLISSSRYGQRVANELDPEKIRSGEFSSSWAERIGTNRLNPEEYSRLVEAAQRPSAPENAAEEPEVQAEKPAEEPAEAAVQAKPAAAAPVLPQRETAAQAEEAAAADAGEQESPVTLEDASKKYGAQAGAMVHTYQPGQDVAAYDRAYEIAYEMGRSGVNRSYAMKSGAAAYLTETQRELAYEAGQAAADTAAASQAEKNTRAANGRSGWKKGTVRGEGVTIADLKQTFNDPQGQAYRYLSAVAEATGIDIALYKSEANAEGEFEGAQGRFLWNENTIYIDVNAGLAYAKDAGEVSKYAMLRTFAHEFTHFIEKWNPVQYNEFRKVVFDTLTERGENVHDLIEEKQAQDSSGKMTYEQASREAVAEAMTDILPDSSFVQELAENHRSIFTKLHEKLKEFVKNLRAYFASIGHNRSREANALKEQVGDAVHYVENIVKMFDQVAVQAVENYQKTVATDEVIAESATTTTEDVQAETKTEVEEEVKPEPEVKTSEPYVSENGYTITDNAEFGSIEISFDGKPSETVRNALKENKFRWHKQKQVWYGKAGRETIIKALDNAYASHKEALEKAGEALRKSNEDMKAWRESITPKESTEETAQEVTAPAQNDVYTSLSEKLRKFNRVDTEHFVFRLFNKDGKWHGKVDAAETDVGRGIMVSNARGVHYTSEVFDTRQEAMEDILAVARNNKLLDERPVNIKEETQNGENEDNQRPVLEPEPDGQGTARLLDELQTEDVQGTGGQRESARPDSEGGRQTERDGNRTDTADRTGGSEGSGESGDLRRNELIQEEKQDKDTKLKETVAEQVEQKSKETPKGKNFVIGESLNLPSGEKARFKANVDAIRLIKQLETEGRYATAAEQEILSKYVGWGGLSNAFGEMQYNRETRKREMVAKSGWEKEFAEFRQLVTDGIITEEEYSAMSASTKNAHYTSMEVIKAMYDGLSQLGFTGGRMLEPSSGVGNFVGGMPVSMNQNVKSWTMVELDRITGQIAKYLYPNADVRIQGFETANIPDNYMDVAIGNVPFGNYGVVDRNYPKRITKAIHNYFFAKSLDKVRPGGLVMFITSSFTMNGQDTSIRQYIMDRADLLGAIRLPNTAFSGNAGTEVVTDILVLKKRAPGTEYGGESFLNAPGRSIDGSWQQVNINEYFDNHPEMVLGTAELSRGMYGANSLTYSPLTDKGTLGDQIREAFKNITGKMDYKTQTTPEKANFSVEKAGKKTKDGGLEVKDGKVFRNESGNLTEVSSDKAMAERVSGLLGIRDAYRQLVNYLQQGQDAKYIQAARKELNKAYDDFVKQYGPINSPKNKSAIAEDPDSYSLLSLENYDTKKKTATKADIFTKDTISPNKTVTHVDDIGSGVIVSINRTGGIDTGLIAKLTGKTQDSVTRELIDSRMAFKTKDGSLETPETYLSGNVRAKLREAEALAPIDKDFQNNVEELRRVIPKDIPFNDIFVAVGTPWIPNNIYADFIAETLGGYNRETSYSGPDVTVGRTSAGEFKIVVNNKRLIGRYQNTQKWGTKRRTFLDLMTALMSNGSLTVNDYIDDGNGRKKAVVNKVETAAAQAKAEEISKEFQEWLWKDENRRKELSSLYNETFNALVPPKYSGKNLTVNGLNAEFSLREHQANAVQRIISSGGNTLLAHKVGAGKTLEMAAAAMKLRELGIVKKPMFVVPKSLVAQWGVEFKSYFPAAKLLVADEKSFTKGNRKTFSNRIANGDYDAVIVSYEQFEKIPMSAAYQQEFYQQQIDEILDAIAEEKAESSSGKGITVKEMEKKKAQLEKKQAELTKKPKDEDNIDFDLLGIDSLFVDEAHNFKNLQYVTRMNNISGLGNTNGSQRAFDLYTKVRYLQGLNGGRGIVFATATPVMNSMAEMYIMQKYLQSDMLEQLGLKTFDAWAKQFGEVVNSVEIKPSGQGFRVKQTFSNFRNLNELQLLFRSFSDVLTDVPGLKIPKMKGGKVNVVVCEPGQFQKDYMAELEKRADNVKNVDPSVDNMLKITSDGRKVSYTQRMIDPTLPYEPGCKIYRCCDNVLAEYKQSKSIKGTQIIFCDMATPKGRSSAATNTEISDDTDLDTSSAQLYDDMKAYLVKKGIPAKEIAFIHDADTDAKKKQLFADVNDGKVRVLIGSTGKMGVGMNAQQRIVAIHHLDAPWRPGDVEQRDGRAFRQKNMNEEVSKYTYVTEGSFDARLWDILDRKQHFIEQIMNGEDIGRSAEDTGDVTLSAAEVKALASGNPMIMEQVQLSNDLTKLNDLKKAHNSNIVAAKAKLLSDEQRIATLNNSIANCKEDIKARVDTYSDKKFSMRVGNQTFTEKKDAGIALSTAIVAKAKQGEFVTVGKFAGFDLRVMKQGAEYIGHITGRQGYKFNVYTENTTYMVNHIIGIVEGLENRLKGWETGLSETIADRDAQEKMIAEPFAKQTELDQKLARYNEVMAILNPKEEQVIGDDDGVQEQSRDYLDEYDAQGNIIPLSERFKADRGDIQYQDRSSPLTDREVLAMAASEIPVDELTDAERNALRIFQERLSRLEALQEQRKELGQLYKEQQFGKDADREEAAKTLNRMHILDGQIQRASTDVLGVEEKTVLRRVLQKARTVVEQQERQHGQEILKRWRDRRNNAAAIKKYRERIRKDVDDLTSWVLHPSNKDVVKHIPDALKGSVIPFLSSINFTSERSLRGGEATKADKEFLKRLNGLKASLKQDGNADRLYEDYSDLPPNFTDRLQAFIDSVQELLNNNNSGDFIINQMTAAELKELSQVVRTLKTYIQNFNKFHVNAMFQHVYEAGDDTIQELSGMEDAGPNTGKISNFVFWQQIRPAYAFERFGKGGMAIYDGLRRGQARLAFNTRTITEFTDKAYTAEEVRAWEKEIKKIKLGDDLVQMPVSAIMSFYELSKRPHALGHILGEGIRVATFKAGGQKISDVGHTITPGDIQTIIGTLTERQKEVADNLQKFMQEQGGKWGNYVSVKRFGEELFGEEHYFPINSDGRHLSANADEHPSAASLYALLNMGFTKELKEKANNRIILYSIFDVFSNHMASMAQYNAFALPVVDALKWFNYQQKSEADENGKRSIIGSVRDQMDRVYGVPEESRPGSGRQGYAQNFVINILKAFNGTEAQGVPTDATWLNELRRYNMAQVAYNFRVVVQQPLAITRAGLLVDYTSILKGMNLRPAAIRQNIEEMRRYSGIAAWKALGFYDVNISRGLTEIIKHKETLRNKISEVGMWGAEQADTITWAAIWSACKEEVTKKQKLRPRDAGFYEAVTRLFEDVIYKTQVVDSVLTKNEYLRSKGVGARLIGSFMSEPTTTASMLIDAFDKYRADLQRGMTKTQAWKKNRSMIGRTAYVYAVSALILAAVQAAADAFRDDDDYETFGEKWLEAFGGNLVDELMPLNKLPVLRDFYELGKELLSVLGVDTYGNAPRSVFMQWYDSLVKGVQILHDKIAGEDTNYTWYGGIYKMLQAVSGMTGLPMAAATREIITAWNTVIGSMAPSLKVQTYEPKPLANIRYAYEDGYLTAEEATAEMLDQDLVDSEDEAYFTIQGWEAGDGYSRFDAIFEAARNGGSIDSEMDELTAHGYTEKDVLSKVKGQIGTWYKEGEITKQQAEKLLGQYFDMDSDEITELVNKWSCVVVTGIEYDDIKQEYLDSNLTEQRAVEMRVRYGGDSKEDAAETVTKWKAEKETGIAYDDIKDALLDGDITEASARKMYVKYGGYSEEEAAEKVTVISFVGEHPDCEDISYAAIEDYTTYCEAAGVSASAFYDVWKYNSSTHADVDENGESISGSKKVKVLAYIDALPLTAAQKDSLYYAFGWAESTIGDSPWH